MKRPFQVPDLHIICMALLAAGLLFCKPARAISSSTDHSGMWWNSTESGWGMNLVQQEQIIFITLFVYGTNNSPTWFVGPATSFTSANASGDRTHTGRLYSTTGTPFAITPFVTPIGVTDVGPITFVGKADGTATLSYTVNGATVNKNIVRQSFAQPTQDLPTTYDIMDAGTTTGCANPANNGPSKILWTGSTMLINGSAITLALKGPATCTYTGTNYTQEGRYGRATLIGRCLNQSPGSVDQTLTLRELEIGQNFFTAQYTDLGGPSATCFQVGLLAGVK